MDVPNETFSEVPNNLRHKFKYTLATANMGYADSPFISITEPTAKLAGKTLALSFKPKTQADEDIIAARIPAPEADGSIDPSKLPTSLPGYLINLTAELSMNGATIKSGAAGKMGGELYEEMGLWSPKEGWETSINHPTAGSYRAIGLDLQGASPEQAARLKQQLEATKAKLESADDIQLATLTKHNLVGDLLYGTVFNYFALNDLQDKIAAQSSNILSYRLPSYGTFSTNLQTQYWFGLPRDVSFAGLSMDIDHMKQHRISKSNNKDESIAFSQSIGARMSAMEHLVPEQMFSTETEKAQGISAVKALAIASQQGQKIWTIDKNNVNLALSRINLGADAETDIRNAVNAGKIATAHEARINFNGWVGEGYTVIDPNTGAGGYIISGGGNGSLLVGGAGLAAVGILGLFAITIGGGLIASLLIADLIIVAFSVGITIVLSELATDPTGEKWNDAKGQLAAIVGMMLVPIFAVLGGSAAIGGVGGGSAWNLIASIVGNVLAVIGVT
jgi:hypothetical protein